MEQGNIQVVWSIRARKFLMNLHKYIAENNPENATRFIDRMVDFGEDLIHLPEKYPQSRFKIYVKRGYHTAVFEKDYVFFYRVKGKKLTVCNIISTSRLK